MKSGSLGTKGLSCSKSSWLNSWGSKLWLCDSVGSVGLVLVLKGCRCMGEGLECKEDSSSGSQFPKKQGPPPGCWRKPTNITPCSATSWICRGKTHKLWISVLTKGVYKNRFKSNRSTKGSKIHLQSLLLVRQNLIYTQTKADISRVDILKNNNLPNHLQRSNIQMTKGPHYLNAAVCVHVCDSVCAPLPPVEL